MAFRLSTLAGVVIGAALAVPVVALTTHNAPSTVALRVAPSSDVSTPAPSAAPSTGVAAAVHKAMTAHRTIVAPLTPTNGGGTAAPVLADAPVQQTGTAPDHTVTSLAAPAVPADAPVPVAAPVLGVAGPAPVYTPAPPIAYSTPVYTGAPTQKLGG